MLLGEAFVPYFFLLLILNFFQIFIIIKFLSQGKVILLKHLNQVIVKILLDEHPGNFIMVYILLDIEEYDLDFTHHITPIKKFFFVKV